MILYYSNFELFTFVLFKTMINISIELIHALPVHLSPYLDKKHKKDKDFQLV